MQSIKKIFFENKSLTFSFDFNIFFFLLVINFITYSIYAVLSKYNILLIEILINFNFIIFFYLYKKNPRKIISFKFSIERVELFFFIFLLFLLIVLTFKELAVPLFGDEIATTKRSTRTALFSSFLLINILDIDYLKEIPFKYLIQILSFFQLLFIGIIIYLLKSKKYFFLILLLLLNFLLRYIIKDTVHHPPLNHIFSSTFISVLGLNHTIVRLSYLFPFWFFLIFLFKLINKYLDKKNSFILIISIATFPLLTIASVVPDHSIWSSLVITYLLFYVILTKKINYFFCVSLVSIFILFRISVFTCFVIIILSFLADAYNRKFNIIEKIKILFFRDKIFIFILLFMPIFLVSIFGTPAFKGIDNVNPIYLFIEAVKSKIILYSLIKQIPFWYYPFIICIFLINKRIEIILFFVFNLIFYFSIQPYLWGNAKYVLEYGVPFFILGYFIFAKMLIDKNKKILFFLLTSLIIGLNIFEISQFPNSRIPVDTIYDRGYEKTFKTQSKDSKYFLKTPYNYRIAFEYIDKIEAKKNTLLLGTTYGFYPEILANYNYKELISVINLRQNFDNINYSNYSLSSRIIMIDNTQNIIDKIRNYLIIMKKTKIVKSEESGKDLNTNIKDKNLEIEKKDILGNINKIKNLKYILLADYGVRKQINDELTSKNWSLHRKFIDQNYRSTLLLFKKN